MCCFGVLTQAQRIETTAKSVEVDELGQIFLVYDNQVDLLSKDLEVQQVYHPFFRDDIHSVDVSRALRPLVFYRDQGRLVYLDNTLSEHNEPIDLYSLEFLNVTATGASADNHVWIFDTATLELYRLDQRLNVTQRSGSLGNWLKGEVSFDHIREVNDQVYMYGESGLIAFDIFGNYYARLNDQPVKRLEYWNEQVIFFQDEWLVWRPGIGAEQFELLKGATENAFLHGNRRIILNRGFLVVESFNNE